MVAASFVTFVDDILSNGVSESKASAGDYFAPFLEGMRLEGSSVMKAPCNQDDMVNVPDGACIKGSPWIQERAFKNLVGDLADPQVTMINDDNFHPASEVYPYHHPEIESDCNDHTGPCTVTHFSVT